MYRKHFVVIFIFIVGIIACNKNVVDGVITFVSPSYFPAPTYNLTNNEITKAKFELGRKLFYETLLSSNNTISCGSCHIQTSAFTHHGHSVSHGIFDRVGTRNSPPIMNLAWSSSYMWDGGVVDLDLQPIVPITNHVEMDDSLPNVLTKLRNHSQYPTLFKNAFGNNEITGVNFLKALSQFMVMCVSDNAKYDSVKRNQASFTDTEAQGYQVFQQKCANCHKEPLFTDYSFRNNGLMPSTLNDEGRMMVTGNTNDRYRFRVPSLRNLSFTAPYMHDGRLLTLEAVLDHYTSGVQATQNLDPLLQQNSQLGIALSANERNSLLAFLKTLDDKSFLLDKRFSEQ